MADRTKDQNPTVADEELKQQLQAELSRYREYYRNVEVFVERQSAEGQPSVVVAYSTPNPLLESANSQLLADINDELEKLGFHGEVSGQTASRVNEGNVTTQTAFRLSPLQEVERPFSAHASFARPTHGWEDAVDQAAATPLIPHTPIPAIALARQLAGEDADRARMLGLDVGFGEFPVSRFEAGAPQDTPPDKKKWHTSVADIPVPFTEIETNSNMIVPVTLKGVSGEDFNDAREVRGAAPASRATPLQGLQEDLSKKAKLADANEVSNRSAWSRSLENLQETASLAVETMLGEAESRKISVEVQAVSHKKDAVSLELLITGPDATAADDLRIARAASAVALFIKEAGLMAQSAGTVDLAAHGIVLSSGKEIFDRLPPPAEGAGKKDVLHPVDAALALSGEQVMPVMTAADYSARGGGVLTDEVLAFERHQNLAFDIREAAQAAAGEIPVEPVLLRRSGIDPARAYIDVMLPVEYTATGPKMQLQEGYTVTVQDVSEQELAEHRQAVSGAVRSVLAVDQARHQAFAAVEDDDDRPQRSEEASRPGMRLDTVPFDDPWTGTVKLRFAVDDPRMFQTATLGPDEEEEIKTRAVSTLNEYLRDNLASDAYYKDVRLTSRIVDEVDGDGNSYRAVEVDVAARSATVRHHAVRKFAEGFTEDEALKDAVANMVGNRPSELPDNLAENVTVGLIAHIAGKEDAMMPLIIKDGHRDRIEETLENIRRVVADARNMTVDQVDLHLVERKADGTGPAAQVIYVPLSGDALTNQNIMGHLKRAGAELTLDTYKANIENTDKQQKDLPLSLRLANMVTADGEQSAVSTTYSHEGETKSSLSANAQSRPVITISLGQITGESIGEGGRSSRYANEGKVMLTVKKLAEELKLNAGPRTPEFRGGLAINDTDQQYGDFRVHWPKPGTEEKLTIEIALQPDSAPTQVNALRNMVEHDRKHHKPIDKPVQFSETSLQGMMDEDNRKLDPGFLKRALQTTKSKGPQAMAATGAALGVGGAIEGAGAWVGAMARLGWNTLMHDAASAQLASHSATVAGLAVAGGIATVVASAAAMGVMAHRRNKGRFAAQEVADATTTSHGAVVYDERSGGIDKEATETLQQSMKAKTVADAAKATAITTTTIAVAGFLTGGLAIPVAATIGAGLAVVTAIRSRKKQLGLEDELGDRAQYDPTRASNDEMQHTLQQHLPGDRLPPPPPKVDPRVMVYPQRGQERPAGNPEPQMR